SRANTTEIVVTVSRFVRRCKAPWAFLHGCNFSTLVSTRMTRPEYRLGRGILALGVSLVTQLSDAGGPIPRLVCRVNSEGLQRGASASSRWRTPRPGTRPGRVAIPHRRDGPPAGGAAPAQYPWTMRWPADGGDAAT